MAMTTNEVRYQDERPKVVFVTAQEELQMTLRVRDAKLRRQDALIAFLEKELVETRLQLASAKSSEDELRLELNKTKFALTEATRSKESALTTSEKVKNIISSNQSARRPPSRHRRQCSLPVAFSAGGEGPPPPTNNLSKSFVAVSANRNPPSSHKRQTSWADTLAVIFDEELTSTSTGNAGRPLRSKKKSSSVVHLLGLSSSITEGKIEEEEKLNNDDDDDGDEVPKGLTSLSSSIDDLHHHPLKNFHNTMGKNNINLDSGYQNLNPGSCSSGLNLLADYASSESGRSMESPKKGRHRRAATSLI